MPVINLLTKVEEFRKGDYPWAVEMWDAHERAHWFFDEVPITDDIVDFWNASEEEKTFIEMILRLFTQNDVEVGRGYDTLLRIFHAQEVQNMLRSFSAREVTHIKAYSYFTDELGYSDNFYKEFIEIPEMNCKVEYLAKSKVKKYEDYEAEYNSTFNYIPSTESLNDYIDRRYKQDIMRMLAVYATATEGISLFAQFAMLLKYQTMNKYKGLGNIVEWSIRDEEMHVQGNSRIFREFVKEFPNYLTDEVKKDIYGAIRQIVEYECELIDYLNPPHMDNETVKNYIKYIADQRLKLIGFKPNYVIETNPLPFMEELNNALALTNFFEGRVTEYTKNSMKGDFDKLRGNEEFRKQYTKKI